METITLHGGVKNDNGVSNQMVGDKDTGGMGRNVYAYMYIHIHMGHMAHNF